MNLEPLGSDEWGYRIPLPMGGAEDTIQVHALRVGDSWWLIDAGMDHPGALESLHEGLRSVGGCIEEIERILLTHTHLDHASLVYPLMDRVPELTVWAHRDLMRLGADEAAILGWFERMGAPDEVGGSFLRNGRSVEYWGRRRLQENVHRLPRGTDLTTSDFRLTWRHTPGHAPDHVCFYEPDRGLLFCGDHVLPEEIPHVGRGPDGEGNPVQSYLDTLNPLMSWSVRRIYPGHGVPFTGLRDRLEQTRVEFRRRLGGVLDSMGVEPRTVWEIARGHEGGKGQPMAEADPLTQFLRLAKTYANLIFLNRHGRVRQNGRRPARFRRGPREGKDRRQKWPDVLRGVNHGET